MQGWSTKYYARVPKGFAANIDYRRKTLETAQESESARRALRRACSEDLLFYINVFQFIHEPREDGGSKVLPFITYPYQDWCFERLWKATGDHDFFAEKSRDMGITWWALTFIAHQADFRKYGAFLLNTRNLDLCDRKDWMGALLPKIDFLHEWTPYWLVPKLEKGVDRIQYHISIPSTKSTIDAEGTTENTGVADRSTLLMLDEFSLHKQAEVVAERTRDVTKTRLVVGTPRGIDIEMYKMRKVTAFERVSIHWTLHPTKSAGLYCAASAAGKGSFYDRRPDCFWPGDAATLEVHRQKFKNPQVIDTKDGKVAIYDHGHVYPPGFEFILDGKIRSPWYDFQCERIGRHNTQSIARELDIEWKGSDTIAFEPSALEYAAKNHVQEPWRRGRLVYDLHTGVPREFVDDPRGRLLLWTPLVDGFPPQIHPYAAGADIGYGQGQANSVLAIWNKVTGEKVAEYADNRIDQFDFAVLTAAVCWWFSGPEQQHKVKVIWDATGGSGLNFGEKLYQRLRYSNIYRRTNAQKTKSGEQIPGFHFSAEAKATVISTYADALKMRRMIQRSAEALEECWHYVHANGTIEHRGRVQKRNQRGEGIKHGDYVIADALACVIMEGGARVGREQELAEEKLSGSAKPFTVGWRFERYMREQRERKRW